MIALLNLENERWTAEVGLDINNPIADQYSIVQTNGALSLVMCNTVAYGGWLAKQVSPLLAQSNRIRFMYTMMIDDCTLACAQVAETDSKITDRDRWTYDGSAQWEMQKAKPGWMFQRDKYVENPDGSWKWTWDDTEVIIPPPAPYECVNYIIEHELDYEAKRYRMASVEVDRVCYELPELWIPAKQVGWEPSQIVTQLQQCNNSQPGGYTLRFPSVAYTL
jgi:hypothetical protein